MVNEAIIWAIFLLPLGSFAFAALVVRPFFNRFSLISGLGTIAALGTALGFSIWTLRSVILGHDLEFEPIEWLVVGGATIDFGLLIDPLTAVMLIVVTGVSLLVQIYSLGYMKGDPRLDWYYAFHALFIASMLTLVLADNFLLLYVAWELVGLCSYLLIGFWHELPSAREAAKKAFIVTRIGDVGLLIGILLLWSQVGSFSMSEAFAALDASAVFDLSDGMISQGEATVAALLLFLGAMGKSAQFPFHVWLPDAMEGPTPVSALIHAATMVAAGVYLVARTYPIFVHSEYALLVVTIIGLITALGAATIALVATDLKRILAYSTISHLGLMMLSLAPLAIRPPSSI